jgi:hypothetical protein
VFSVRYKLGFYIPEDDILHSHRRENLKFYNVESLDDNEYAGAVFEPRMMSLWSHGQNQRKCDTASKSWTANGFSCIYFRGVFTIFELMKFYKRAHSSI